MLRRYISFLMRTRAWWIVLARSDLQSSSADSDFNLGILGKVLVNGVDRSKYSNSLYGADGQDFITAEERRVVVVVLSTGTGRDCWLQSE